MKAERKGTITIIIIKKKTALQLSRNLVGRPGRNEEFSFAIYIYI